MECPICHMVLQTDAIYDLHVAMHREAAALARRRGITYYDCPNRCTVTGSNPPAACKHGKAKKA